MLTCYAELSGQSSRRHVLRARLPDRLQVPCWEAKQVLPRELWVEGELLGQVAGDEVIRAGAEEGTA